MGEYGTVGVAFEWFVVTFFYGLSLLIFVGVPFLLAKGIAEAVTGKSLADHYALWRVNRAHRRAVANTSPSNGRPLFNQE